MDFQTFWKVAGWQDRTLASLGDPDAPRRPVLWDCPRPIRNPMPPMTLFPRVERLEAAAHTWSRRIRAAVDCLTGRMDLELGYDDDGWD